MQLHSIEILDVTKNRFQIAFLVEWSIRALEHTMWYTTFTLWREKLLQTSAQDAVYNVPPCTCSIQGGGAVVVHNAWHDESFCSNTCKCIFTWASDALFLVTSRILMSIGRVSGVACLFSLYAVDDVQVTAARVSPHFHPSLLNILYSWILNPEPTPYYSQGACTQAVVNTGNGWPCHHKRN